MIKRLIEYSLPLAEISEASAREKNIRHGYPRTLHIWGELGSGYCGCFIQCKHLS